MRSKLSLQINTFPRLGFRSNGMSRSAEWYLATDVSGHHNGPILMCQAVQDTCKNSRKQASVAWKIRVTKYCEM